MDYDDDDIDEVVASNISFAFFAFFAFVSCVLICVLYTLCFSNNFPTVNFLQDQAFAFFLLPFARCEGKG